jgi:ABC-type transporter Mla subunit MlaD
MWLPEDIEVILNELRADARDLRNWSDLIEGAITDLEQVLDQLARRLPEVPDAEFRQVLVI